MLVVHHLAEGQLLVPCIMYRVEWGTDTICIHAVAILCPAPVMHGILYGSGYGNYRGGGRWGTGMGRAQGEMYDTYTPCGYTPHMCIKGGQAQDI